MDLPMMDRVMQFITAGPATMAEITGAIAINPYSVRNHVTRLRASGKIKMVGLGQYTRIYCLPELTAEEALAKYEVAKLRFVTPENAPRVEALIKAKKKKKPSEDPLDYKPEQPLVYENGVLTVRSDDPSPFQVLIPRENMIAF